MHFALGSRDFGRGVVGSLFVFRAGVNASESARIERMKGGRANGGWSIEAVENRVPIYQGVHEDELDSGAVEVSPLRKYPILPVRQKRLCRITATGMA